MAKMFKLLENELDALNAALSYTKACVKNVETLADYILEDDDRSKYLFDMISITDTISQYMFSMNLKIESEKEHINSIKKDIVNLVYP